MRSISRAATAIGLIGLALAAVAGAFIGVRAGASASEPGVSELRVDDPALAAGPPAHAWYSPGGFTGFGGAALAGEVIAAGVVASVESAEGGGGTLVFRDGGRETSVRYLDGTRLFELVSGAELAEGDTVMLRLKDGDVVGILRIPSDLADDTAQGDDGGAEPPRDADNTEGTPADAEPAGDG